MALFSFNKDKRDDGDVESVLAYLEDLQRTRTPLIILDAKKKEATAQVNGIDEGAGQITLQLQGPMVGAAKGGDIELLFMSEGLRIGAPTRILDVRGTTLQVDIPASLELRERRKEPRARLLAKEPANLTALTELFGGVGLNGSIENLSENGARVKVEKAMAIKGEKKLPLTQNLVPAGQTFMIVKVNAVPKCPPTLELSGKAVYLEQAPGGLFVGVKFDKAQSPVRSFLSTRASSLPKTVPAKTRRRAPRPVDPDDSPRKDTPAAPKVVEPDVKPKVEATAIPAPSVAAPEAAPAEASQSPALASPSLPTAADPTPAESPEPEVPFERVPPNPIMRLKKRSRALLVLAAQARLPMICAALEEDGFGRVIGASTYADLLPYLDEPNLGVLFMDLNESVLGSLQVLREIHAAHEALPPVVLAAEEISKAVVVAAAREGARQLIVKPYALDDAFFVTLEQALEQA